MTANEALQKGFEMLVGLASYFWPAGATLTAFFGYLTYKALSFAISLSSVPANSAHFYSGIVHPLSYFSFLLPLTMLAFTVIFYSATKTAYKNTKQKF